MNHLRLGANHLCPTNVTFELDITQSSLWGGGSRNKRKPQKTHILVGEVQCMQNREPSSLYMYILTDSRDRDRESADSSLECVGTAVNLIVKLEVYWEQEKQGCKNTTFTLCIWETRPELVNTDIEYEVHSIRCQYKLFFNVFVAHTCLLFISDTHVLYSLPVGVFLLSSCALNTT